MQVNDQICKEISGELEAGAIVYLHRKTGEIITIHNIDDDWVAITGEEDPYKEDRKKVKKSPKDYLAFEPMDSSQSFRVMEDFIDQLTNKDLANRLVIALQKRRPFAHFKDEIDHSGSHRQEWFDFRFLRYMEWVREQWEDQML